MTLLDYIRIARETLRRHADARDIEFNAAVSSRVDVAVQVRHAAWRELYEAGWPLNRIGRAFGTSHSVVLKALRKTRHCPACGEKFERTTEAPRIWTCGVATHRAYHHAGAVCVVQTAWVHRGEEAPVGGGER